MSKRITRVWDWLTAGLTVATGICLMAGCISIYRSGDRPFSPESIAAQFGNIAWLVWLTVAAIIVGIALHLLFPDEKGRVKAIREEKDILGGLKTKAGTVTDGVLSEQLAKAQRGARTAHVLFCSVLGVASSQLFLFFFEPFRFSIEHLNRDILQFAVLFGISCGIVLITMIICVYLTRKSLKQQIHLYKAAIAEGKCDGIPPAPAAKKNTSAAITIARVAVAAAAVIFIVLGMMNEGILDVLGKAIAICTECIGLG
jgi:FtsH-binding integral membrane protein